MNMNALSDQIWQDFLKIIKEEVGTRVVETWIKAVLISRYDSESKVMYVSAPNLFVKNWVESNYQPLFEKHFKRLLSIHELKVCFELAGQPSAMNDSRAIKVVPAVAIEVKKKKQELVKKSLGYQTHASKLNPIYTFDSFVVGENSQFAYASARAIVDKLGTLYNPLLLYGSSGLGKTHLLHAIGNSVLEKYPNQVVLYQTTDRFITEFINAIRFDGIAKFQAKYKDVDVLLVDDIQFMVNKEQTQEAFFHIFNNLYETNKQIVLSCDTLPRYLGGLVDRLKSRLEWGLIADVQVPMLETKIAILKRKAHMQREVISDDVALFIAQQNISSVRELEGSLIRVLAYASLTNQSISIDLVKKVLGAQERVHSVVKIDFRDVVVHIKKHFAYSLEDLRSKDRSKGVSHARQVAMYLMKNHTDKSLREIGEFLDRKDHTTITHAVHKIIELRNSSEKFAHLLKNIEDELR